MATVEPAKQPEFEIVARKLHKNILLFLKQGDFDVSILFFLFFVLFLLQSRQS